MGGSSSSYDTPKSRYNWSDDAKVTRRKASDYAKSDDREYIGHKSKGLPAPVGKEIATDSDLVAIVMLDKTGSMKEAPAKVLEKFATYYSESNALIQGCSLEELKEGKKLENKLEVALLAVGDVGDSYVLQVTDFAKGKELIKNINEVYPEGGGGSNIVESYDLAAYFLLNHCKTPNVKKPLLIIAGDEGFYQLVKKDRVKKYIGDTIGQDLDATKMMKELAQKFDTYILRPEMSYSREDYDKVQKQWESVLGPERVMRMLDYSRLIDCAVAIAGYYSQNLGEGVKILKRRQTPEQVKEVLDIIHPLTQENASKKST
ncbi:VWA domain-containing protein [Candidatus Pacearchaeota archaeon]|nr:VWA domain-containing protein [Candidatus Pacearchaeota archaeon]